MTTTATEVRQATAAYREAEESGAGGDVLAELGHRAADAYARFADGFDVERESYASWMGTR